MKKWNDLARPYRSTQKIFGKNIIQPTMTEMIAENSTAPAAISFANFAFSLISGIAISTVVSIAVFISSNEMTNANNNRHIIHSIAVILNMIPAIITSVIIIKCIFKFCSVLHASFIP